jgi:hypothetical protein
MSSRRSLSDGTRIGKTFSRQRLGASDPLILPLLEEAEQPDLEVDRQLADLVEEEGAARGAFDATGLLLQRAGERAPFVAEEFAREEFSGEQAAIDGDERAVATWRAAVNGPGDQFLARAGFTGDENRGIGGRDKAGISQHLSPGRADAHALD